MYRYSKSVLKNSSLLLSTSVNPYLFIHPSMSILYLFIYPSSHSCRSINSIYLSIHPCLSVVLSVGKVSVSREKPHVGPSQGLNLNRCAFSLVEASRRSTGHPQMYDDSHVQHAHSHGTSVTFIMRWLVSYCSGGGRWRSAY